MMNSDTFGNNAFLREYHLRGAINPNHVMDDLSAFAKDRLNHIYPFISWPSKSSDRIFFIYLNIRFMQ